VRLLGAFWEAFRSLLGGFWESFGIDLSRLLRNCVILLGTVRASCLRIFESLWGGFWEPFGRLFGILVGYILADWEPCGRLLGAFWEAFGSVLGYI